MKVVVDMKKMVNRKNILRVLSLIFVIMVLCTNFIYAELGGELDPSILSNVTDENYDTNARILTPVKKVFSTIYTILQVAGMAGVVYTGVKYMYAGAQDKAEIKKTLVLLLVGVIFLFGAPAIINFIQDAATNTLVP